MAGAGECGKSTILKQMKIMHDNGFTLQEIVQQKSVIYYNIVQSMTVILKAMKFMKIPLEDQEREVDARVVLDLIETGDEYESFSFATATALKLLWKDEGVKECFSRRSEYQLNDSAKYFFDNLDRISERTFEPTEKDILHARLQTTGIVEVDFKLSNIILKILDVGGQRSERKKWIHCFQDVNAIIFISAISEYDQVIREDERTNRMVESMNLFESICNSRWFFKKSFILFLNKIDVFEEKISKTSIKAAFPEYDGMDRRFGHVLWKFLLNQFSAQTFDASVEFIEEKFEGLVSDPKRTIYTHQTCATDTDQVALVLDNVTDTIINRNLKFE